MLVARIPEAEGAVAVVRAVVFLRPMAPAVAVTAEEVVAAEVAEVVTVQVSPRLFVGGRIRRRNSSSTTSFLHPCRRLSSRRRCW